jgi:hypothetical protein
MSNGISNASLQASAAAEGFANLRDPLFLLFAVGIVVTLFVLVRLLRSPPDEPDARSDASERAGDA